ALRCRALMWSGLLSIGRTARRTWAMDAADVARTAPSAGAGGMSSAYVDGIALTKEAIGLARNSKDPALLLETLTIGSLHFAAIGSLHDVLRAMNDEAGMLAGRTRDSWQLAFVGALRGMQEYVAGDLAGSMTKLRAAIDTLTPLGGAATGGFVEISFSEVAELRGEIGEATTAMARALAVDTECG